MLPFTRKATTLSGSEFRDRAQRARIELLESGVPLENITGMNLREYRELRDVQSRMLWSQSFRPSPLPSQSPAANQQASQSMARSDRRQARPGQVIPTLPQSSSPGSNQRALERMVKEAEKSEKAGGHQELTGYGTSSQSNGKAKNTKKTRM